MVGVLGDVLGELGFVAAAHFFEQLQRPACLDTIEFEVTTIELSHTDLDRYSKG